MKRRFAVFFLLPALFLVLINAVQAAETPTTEEIVARANKAAYYAGDDGRAEVRMVITDAQGRTRERELVMLRRDVTDGGEQKFYVYFKKPGDVRKMVFMVHKYLDRDDDRWLYLPAMDLVKRIAASDKRTSFVGSHFVYEDVSGRGVDEDEHELVETTDSHFILNNIPKDPAGVEFSSYRVWIDRTSFLPVKAEYVDREGRAYRLVEALEVQTIQDHPTVVRSRVRDLAGGGETVADFTDIRYDLGLDDSIFTERYLRRPPREVR
ncbi:MAG: outer membrane lipoprotein-sorting protein [Desulfobulbaceae bacterium]|nr:outer membrane lipoprotein-sorting protein [Desulfobulbaceae bacterium]